MAAGHLPDAVGHGHDRKTERRGNAENVDGRGPFTHPRDHSRPATDQNQSKRPNEFGDRLVHTHSSPMRYARETRRHNHCMIAPRMPSQIAPNK